MFAKELNVAKQAALAAGEAIMRHYKTDCVVTDKGEGHPVTIADREANSAIRNLIVQHFPYDAWLSEEDADDLARLSKSRLWVVDPLDGTRDFIRHNPEFAVSIALVVDHESILGVIYNPVTDELFWGCQGQGVWLGNERQHVAKKHNGKVSVLASQSEYNCGDWQRYENIFDVRPTGGTAYKMALVAAGRADACFTLQSKNEWDICAGHLLVTESGGKVSTASGEPVTFNNRVSRLPNLLYSNGVSHAGILAAIQKSS